MKKLMFIALFAIATANLFAQTENKKGLANVTRMQGYYLFTDCVPVMDYELLGTIKGPGMSMGSGQYTDIRDKLIKRCQKDYPKADGIIFYFNDGGRDRADAIMFK